MPGLYKTTNESLQFIRKLYIENPKMSFKQMLPIYNNEAQKRGWMLLRSSGTISYHLTILGLYKRGTRAPEPVPNYAQEIIELGTKARKLIMKEFGISGPNLSLTLRRKRNGKNAEAIRNMAMQLGGKLFIYTGVEVKPTKVLDSKGNITGVITIK